jgi:hypothetical protein
MPKKRSKKTSTKKPGAKPSAAKKPSSRSGAKPAAKNAQSRYAGISSESVRKATGKTWSEWFAILDAHDAWRLQHREIAEYLSEQRRVPPWWSQMVTVGYEQARGLRKKHETSRGFSISASRVVVAPLNESWLAFADRKLRAQWLDQRFRVSSQRKHRSLRGALDDDTRLEVMFYPKGEGLSQISVQHNKLANEKQARASKKAWAKRLDELRHLLETSALFT